MRQRNMRCVNIGVLLFGLTCAASGQMFHPVQTVSIPGDTLRNRGFFWAAVGDYDNDGHTDIAVARVLGMLHNEGGQRLVDRPVFPFLRARIIGNGTVFGDYDNDGDLDLFVPGGEVWVSDPNALLRNDAGSLTEVTTTAGLSGSYPTESAVWLDYDRDGLLDLYTGSWLLSHALNGSVADPPLRNRLHRNQGDGTFRDVTVEAGLDIDFALQMGTASGRWQPTSTTTVGPTSTRRPGRRRIACF